MNAQEVFCPSIRSTIFLILSVFFTSIAGQAADPDFSGTWRFNPSQSTVQRAPLPPGKLLNIQHRGIAVTCEALTEASTPQNCSFTTDRKESRHESNDVTRSTVAKWEGDTLLINTIVMMKSGAQYTQMDRWTLSRDRTTLRIRRQTVSSRGNSESHLIYERSEAPAAASEAAPAVSAVRFGRRLAVPAEPNRYTYEKLGGLEAPTLQTDKYTVTCIAYRDAKRLFVETVIRNRADTAASLGQPFVLVQAGGRTLSMLDTARVAEEIHAGAVRDFVPTASGTDARTNQPLYDRRLVGEQAKRHIETQEREETFAALLLTFAYKESPTSIPAGEENTFIATFEPPEEKAGFEVCLRVGGEEFRFPFYS